MAKLTAMKFVGGMCAVAGMMLVAQPAFADGHVGMKDAPAPERSRPEFSFNLGFTTDYVFRGISQSASDPAFQGGVDMTWGIFYAGVWASQLDFGTVGQGTNAGLDAAPAEVDLYLGITPEWGPLSFDFGGIYYMYPSGKDNFLNDGVREYDFFELKAGVSATFVPNLTTGLTVYYSPDYTNEQGPVTTIEGSVEYELPKMWVFTPTVGGTVGTSIGDFDLNAFNAGGSANPGFVIANGDDSYAYWNAGLTLAVEALSLDFRYWDTDIANANPTLGR